MDKNEKYLKSIDNTLKDILKELKKTDKKKVKDEKVTIKTLEVLIPGGGVLFRNGQGLTITQETNDYEPKFVIKGHIPSSTSEAFLETFLRKGTPTFFCVLSNGEVVEGRLCFDSYDRLPSESDALTTVEITAAILT